MRLFIALPLTGAARGAVADVARSGLQPAGWRWTDPETWHVTVAFLGEVDEHRRHEVEGVLEAAGEQADGPIELEVTHVEPVQRRMVWLRLADRPAGAVAALGADLQHRLGGAQLPVQEREVTPHVTVARWRGEGDKAPAGQVVDPPAVDLAWTAREVVLYRSHLGSDGARHEMLAVAALG